MANKKPGEKRRVPDNNSLALLKKAKTFESQGSIYPNLFGSGVPAPVISKGEGLRLIDVDGNVFIDAIGGMACAVQGYHPKEVIESVKNQLDKASFLPEMVSDSRIALSQRVMRIAPGELKHGKIQFELSGSSAVDLSLQIASYYVRTRVNPSASKVLSFWGAYHGRSIGPLSVGGITDYKDNRPEFPGTMRVPYPYCSRCPYSLKYGECKLLCLEVIEQTVENHYNNRSKKNDIFALIAEPFQSHVARIPPPEFYPRLREICGEYNIVFIDDEIVGFLHTGKWFGCENWQVVPDIIVIAKPLSAGVYPISAVIAKKDIFDTWENTSDMHFSTYMAHPAACAAALSNLSILERDNLVASSSEKGNYLMGKLRELENKHNSIANIQGIGLWISLEIMKSKTEFEPDEEKATRLCHETATRGLIIDKAYGSSRCYLVPPLIVTCEEIDLMTRILDDSLQCIEGR